jgi:hypothetical protein
MFSPFFKKKKNHSLSVLFSQQNLGFFRQINWDFILFYFLIRIFSTIWGGRKNQNLSLNKKKIEKKPL